VTRDEGTREKSKSSGRPGSPGRPFRCGASVLGHIAHAVVDDLGSAFAEPNYAAQNPSARLGIERFEV